MGFHFIGHFDLFWVMCGGLVSLAGLAAAAASLLHSGSGYTMGIFWIEVEFKCSLTSDCQPTGCGNNIGTSLLHIKLRNRGGANTIAAPCKC